MNNQAAITKLEKLETELFKLKKGGIFKLSKKNISLKGILKGVKISGEHIKKAKKSLFKEIEV